MYEIVDPGGADGRSAAAPVEGDEASIVPEGLLAYGLMVEMLVVEKPDVVDRCGR